MTLAESPPTSPASPDTEQNRTTAMPDQTQQLVDELRRRFADPGAVLPRRFADGLPAEGLPTWRARAVAAGLADGSLGYVPAARSTHLMTELLQTAIDRDNAQAARDRLAERLQGVTVNFDRIAAELADAERDNARLERRCDRLTSQRDEAQADRDRFKAELDEQLDLGAELLARLMAVSAIAERWTSRPGTPEHDCGVDIRQALDEGTAPVPGSSRPAQEPDEAAIRVDERADIARQLELLAADEALIADWVTTCDPIPLTVPDWLRALAGKIRAGDPESECRDLYPDRPITGAPLCPKGCGIPIWRHAVIPVAGESQASEPAPTRLTQGGITRRNIGQLASAIDALTDAYWKIRDHAREYRNTEAYRRHEEAFHADRGDPVAVRYAVRDRWYANGIDAAARDIAELIGVPEVEIGRNAGEPAAPKLAQGGRRSGCGPDCSEGHTFRAGCEQEAKASDADEDGR